MAPVTEFLQDPAARLLPDGFAVRPPARRTSGPALPTNTHSAAERKPASTSAPVIADGSARPTPAPRTSGRAYSAADPAVGAGSNPSPGQGRKQEKATGPPVPRRIVS
ncbi:hypothetical protein [Streptomyces cinereoruber]|uniref:hypothetical protein n=1 Tax=Streptomyces cinereoruber TaxID=67260 RepID=UPI0036346578